MMQHAGSVPCRRRYVQVDTLVRMRSRSVCTVLAFIGEAGADSGALRKEFFEDGLREVDSRLLEGPEDRRIVKKDCNLEMEFEIAGMLVAHSIIQGGPALPCLSESMFCYIFTGIAMECYPSHSSELGNARPTQLHQ